MIKSRREFLQTLSALGGAGLATRFAFGAIPVLTRDNDIPIALQLYSLRQGCETDLPGTLSAVGKMGFEGVEWFGWGGYFDRTPQELRKMLDDNNLKTVSDHIHADALQGDNFERTVELHQTLGNNLVTLSDLTGVRGDQTTADYWLGAAELLNELAEKLAPLGMSVGLHNHRVEMVRLEDGQLPWDIIFDNTRENVTQQLHLSHFPANGLNAVDYLKKYPGRTLTMHMVDWAPERRRLLLGEGEMNWQEIFDAAEEVGGTQWYIVEQESYPVTPLESVEQSYTNLKELLSQGAP